MLIKIMTMCRQGLVRSVGMTDVLKLHFEPVDVIPLGYAGNTSNTLQMISSWADKIIIMREKYKKYIPEEFHGKVFICDVGHDNYHSAQHPKLIAQAWTWLRRNQDQLGIKEHNRSV